MNDSLEHNPGDHEDPLAGPTWAVSFVSIGLFVAIVLGVTALAYTMRDAEIRTAVIDQPNAQVEGLKAAQNARLTAPPHRELRAENGGDPAIVIPIDEAMRRIAQEHGQGG